jgi:molybdopterin-guanine dinucleotide biosynthesis protein A
MTNSQKIPDTAGIILAGGNSTRFGSNKALAMLNDMPLIRHVADILSALFDETLLITNTPEIYEFLDWPARPDIFAKSGPLAGIHAALQEISSSRAFVVGCDMPFLDGDLIRFICSRSGKWDAVIPRHSMGMEPLHAVYTKPLLPLLEKMLAAGERKVGGFVEKLNVRWVEEKEILAIVPDRTPFHNINRRQDMQRHAISL